MDITSWSGWQPQWALEESGLEVVAQSEGAWLFVPEGRCINAEKPADFYKTLEFGRMNPTGLRNFWAKGMTFGSFSKLFREFAKK